MHFKQFRNPAPISPARSVVAAGIIFALCLVKSTAAETQSGVSQAVDPGPRGGPAGAGGPLTGLDEGDIAFFNATLVRFREIVSVTGSIPGEAGNGLGPRFNGNSCAGCHAYPAVGGSSPAVNPQIALATLDGATNNLPNFVRADGPVREARFLRNPDASLDGSVHNLFTITGRGDAKGCILHQPNFAQEMSKGNVALRIPTGLFGLGLLENTRDSSLEGQDYVHKAMKTALGISGHFNRGSDDGRILRFGWKAQERSLLSFAGEAYNIEIGVTNEVYPDKRSDDPKCAFSALPEDSTNFKDAVNSFGASDTVMFAGFMRLSAPPTPSISGQAARNGQRIFSEVGCESCHFETQTTTASVFAGQSIVKYHPYSDFEVHAMGTALADGLTQGNATGSQFRTAPLWGLGQRLFFLHDGRTKNLVTAIEAHASSGSEANQVIARFNALPKQNAQDLLIFLRSL